MRRRVRLTESQLRNIVEESSRRVIQEMIDEGFLDDIGNAFKSGWNSLYNSGTGKNVRQGINNAKKTVTNAADWVGNQATNAANWVGNQATNAYNTAKQGADWVGNQATNAANWVGNQATNAYNTAKQGVKKYGPSAVATGLFGLPGWLATNPQTAGKVAGQVANGAQRVGNTIANGAQRIGNGIGNWLGSFRQGYNNQRR